MITEKQISEAINAAYAQSVKLGDAPLKRGGIIEGFADGVLWTIEQLQPEIDRANTLLVDAKKEQDRHRSQKAEALRYNDILRESNGFLKAAERDAQNLVDDFRKSKEKLEAELRDCRNIANGFASETQRSDAENKRLKDLLITLAGYAKTDYSESAACRIIASEIHKALNSKI